MKKILGALVGVLFALVLVQPAVAMDRVQMLFGQNPPSSWANYASRYTRVGFGQLIYDLYANTSGFYSNLTPTPVTGLFVAIGPSSASTIGSLYQYLPEEVTSFGGPGGTALAADPNQVYLQGLASTTGPNIGPLIAGTSGGQSVIDLIECKVQTADQTSQTGTFVSTLGVVTTSAVNRDRADTVSCQYKASASSVTPTVPTVDTGFIAVGYFTIPNATLTVTSGMYTPILSTRFSALSHPLYTQTGQTLPGIPHSVFLTKITFYNSLITCGPMVNYYCSTTVISGQAAFSGPATFTCATSWSGQNNFFAGYYGFNYQAINSIVFFGAWNNGNTVYIGTTAAGGSGSVINVTCSGY